MKPLTNVSELIDAWAHQDRPDGHVGNVSFQGQRLFSYKTPVAAIVARSIAADTPPRICLTIYRRHSVTTSGHISQARVAASKAGLSSVAVATIDAPLDHQRNLLGIAEDAMSHLRKAGKARVHAEHYLQRAAKRLLEMNLYASFYGLPVKINPKCTLTELDELLGQLQSMEVAA